MRLVLVSLTAALLVVGCGDDDDGGTDSGPADTGTGGDTSPDTGGGVDCDALPNACATAGTSCMGDNLVTCAADSDGCLVESTNDCSRTNDGTCDDSGSAAVCIEDPCAGKTNVCQTEGRACDGDSVVICAPDADGCLIEETTDCTAMNGVCDDDGAMPMCAFPVDPCEGLTNTCTTEGNTCDGDDLVACAPNAFGCLVETRTDCGGEVLGGFCDASGDPVCTTVGEFDCTDHFEVCDEEGVACEDTNLVTCAPNAFGCLIEAREDCSEAMFGICNPDTPACETQAIDPCAGLNLCTEEGRACNGTTVEVCAFDANGCLVQTDTDCATDGDTCELIDDEAVCFGDPCEPATTFMMDLSCANEGTPVMGDTADGTDILAGYCGLGTYEGMEVIYRFTNDTAADVNIDATAIEANDRDFDLFVLRDEPATLCGPSSECPDFGRALGADENVDFAVLPGETFYIVYDLFTSTEDDADTATFNLNITCVAPTCGDGVLGAGEECDDGNTGDSDGCSSTCMIEDTYSCTDDEPSVCMVVCGNDVVDGDFGETCDDGNTMAGDGCSDSCQREDGYICDDSEPQVCELACGNGERNRGEACDDGNTDADDGCAADCTVEDGYVCDEPEATSVCEIACGNGDLDDGEECDDGNTDAADGCAADCTIEDGFICEEEPSVCTASCGDGIVAGARGEECDDMNTTDGDGCAADCTLEDMYRCAGEPSVCSNTCGNTTVDPGESCDGGDDCTASCALAVSDMAGGMTSVSGTLAETDPTWSRVSASCAVNTSSDFYYHMYVVENATGSTQDVLIDVDWTDLDGYVAVFLEPFSPSEPTGTCLGADDDFLDDTGSRVEARMPDGFRLVVIVTTSDSGDTGDYMLNVITSGGCGDGFLLSTEECDDMNTDTGDGCSDVCEIENLFVCDDEVEPTTCVTSCPNADVDFSVGETCDDDNDMDGDGCSAMCSVEMNFICTDEPSVCFATIAEFEGELDDTDESFTRAGSGCGTSTTQTEFDTYTYTNDSGVAQVVDVVGNWTFDGYLHVYDNNGFDPMDPTTNCVGGDDDEGFLGASRVNDIDVAPGESITIVASAFSTGRGTYKIGIILQPPPLAEFMGELDAADMTWTRPGSSCSAGSSTLPFETHTYTNSTAATQTVSVTASWTFDGYLHVFDNNGFDSTMPTVNCVAGDDDFGGTGGSQVTGINVAAGESITIVASAFGGGLGTYTITVDEEP